MTLPLSSKFRLLLVDDEPNNLHLLNYLLNEAYELNFAKSGEEALDRVEQQRPDLILLDIMMPGMDGYEVCRRLKQHPENRAIPVLFLTAMSNDEDEALGFDLGAVDYITKPIRPAVVQRRISTHLQLKKQQQYCEQRVISRTKELERSRHQSLNMLGRAAEYRDNETGLHVVRMARYSQLLARRYGLSESEQNLILNAAPMHDVGKIGIRDSILLKPGKLDEKEWSEMKKHPEIGAKIIGQSGMETEIFRSAHQIALSHHERWDGSGYPQQLEREHIPLSGRIIAISDVFDALTTARPYKKAWPLEKALKLLQEESGRHFDPNLIPLFFDILPQILTTMEQFKEQDHEPE
ncbi:MAG: response regulator [Gammaproteobacteria bacterium]|nr:response regulator [Gammaproteobacteria bacterium]